MYKKRHQLSFNIIQTVYSIQFKIEPLVRPHHVTAPIASTVMVVTKQQLYTLCTLVHRHLSQFL